YGLRVATKAAENNLVPVNARLARGSALAIGQSASELKRHRVRSTSLAIGADDLDARGRSPMMPSKDPAIVRRRSRGSLPRLHLVQAIAAPAYDTVGVPGANCDRTIRFFWRVPFFAIFLNESSPHTGVIAARPAPDLESSSS